MSALSAPEMLPPAASTLENHKMKIVPETKVDCCILSIAGSLSVCFYFTMVLLFSFLFSPTSFQQGEARFCLRWLYHV